MMLPVYLDNISTRAHYDGRLYSLTFSGGTMLSSLSMASRGGSVLEVPPPKVCISPDIPLEMSLMVDGGLQSIERGIVAFNDRIPSLTIRVTPGAPFSEIPEAWFEDREGLWCSDSCRVRYSVRGCCGIC
jgi:hypothetical protein